MLGPIFAGFGACRAPFLMFWEALGLPFWGLGGFGWRLGAQDPSKKPTWLDFKQFGGQVASKLKQLWLTGLKILPYVEHVFETILGSVLRAFWLHFRWIFCYFLTKFGYVFEDP